MRVVRSPDSSVPDTSLSGDAGRALQLFSEHILEHRLIQRQLCYQLLQTGVLIPQLLQLSDLIHLKANVLGLPVIKFPFADPNLRISSAIGTPTSACFRTDTICYTENFFFMAKSLRPLKSWFCRNTNSQNRSVLARPFKTTISLLISRPYCDHCSWLYKEPGPHVSRVPKPAPRKSMM